MIVEGRLRWLSFALLLVVVSSGPAAAEPRRSAALLGVSGPNGPALSALLEYGLERRFVLVRGDDYRAAAKALGMPGPSPREVRAVARQQRIDAVLAGATRKRPDRALQLRIVVRDGATGLVVGRVDRVLVDGTLDEGERDDVCDELVRIVARAHARPAPAPTDAPPPDEDPGPSPLELDDDAPSGAAGRAHPTGGSDDAPLGRGAGSDDAPLGSRGGSDDAPLGGGRSGAGMDGAVAQRAGGAGREALDVDVGIGLLARSLAVDAPGTRANGGGAVAALALRGALYPLALDRRFASSHPVLAAFGVEAGATLGAPFTSQSSTGQMVGSQAWRWDAALAARIPLRSLTLTLAFGYGALTFGSDDARGLGVPDVSYGFLRPRAALTLPLGTPRVTATVGGGALLLLDAGAIGATPGYGAASAFGGEGEVALSVRATSWLLVRGRARYDIVSLTFQGGGSSDARSARDQIFEAAVELGYVTR